MMLKASMARGTHHGLRIGSINFANVILFFISLFSCYNHIMPSPGNKYFADSIFWIEVEKISPNPFQPRRDFDEAKLKDLAESIRMYGVLQPLVVTRREMP